MKRLLRIPISLALIMGSLESTGTGILVAQTPQYNSPQYIAKLTKVSGVVEVKYQGISQPRSERSTSWQKIKQGDWLKYGDLLRV